MLLVRLFRLILLGLVMATLLALGVAALASAASWLTGGLLGCLGFEFVAFWYLARVKHGFNSLRLTQAQFNATIHDRHIADDALARAITVLTPEEHTVFDVTRLKWLYAARLSAVPLLLSMGCIIGGIIASTLTFKWPHYGAHPYTTDTHLPIGLPLILLGLVFLLIVPFFVLDWWFKYLVFTDKGLHIVTIPSPWLPWMKSPRPFLPWNIIMAANNKDTGWGNMIGYGGIDLATLIPQQKIANEFDPVEWVPSHRYYVQLINEKILTAVRPTPRP